MKNIQYLTRLLLIIILLIPAASHAKITESQFKKLKVHFLRRIIRDNPHFKKQIRATVVGIIPDGNAGMRLLDKFALFLHDMQKNHLQLARSKYFYKNRICMFILIMKDTRSDQNYTLYLEYDYNYRRKLLLRDAFFSAVFTRKQKRVIQFFKNK